MCVEEASQVDPAVVCSSRDGQARVPDSRLYMWCNEQMRAHARAVSPGVALERSHACKREMNVYSIDAIKVW